LKPLNTATKRLDRICQMGHASPPLLTVGRMGIDDIKQNQAFM